MKKFTFIIAAMLLTSLTFAQLLDTPISVKAKLSGEKTDWYTYWEDDGSGYIGINLLTAGEKLAMRYTPAQLADMLDANPQLTKVSVGAWAYTYEGVDYNNYNFTLEIYEGGSYDDVTGVYTPGTMIHTQAITAAQSWTEHTLSTPVDVDITQDLMIAIVMTGNSCFIQSHSAVPTASTFGNLYYDPTESAWFDLEFYTDETMTETEVLAWAIKAYIEDEAVYVENSDLSAFYIDNQTDQNIITELVLGTTDDLDVLPVIYNAGPDDADQVIAIEFTVDGTSMGSQDFDPATGTTEGYIGAPGGIMFPTTLMTAEEMDTEGLTTFDVCITLTYSGVDNNSANNTTCLSITRGEAPVTECDLEAIFMTSNADQTPIASTLAITATDNITVFPAIINNGPDAATATATITLTINAIPIAAPQTISMSGLPSGSFAPLTTAGQPITAANMDAMGLTGTFDVCMTVTYNGTDNNTVNNTTCVAVTRDPVNVESNIASAISIYPNPANNVVTVANAENSNIVITNMLGEVVATVENASSVESINISNLANGTYFVRVNSEIFKINVIK